MSARFAIFLVRLELIKENKRKWTKRKKKKSPEKEKEKGYPN
jgi:hypothetical protein